MWSARLRLGLPAARHNRERWTLVRSGLLGAAE